MANIKDQEWMWEYAIYDDDIEEAAYHDRVVANQDSDVFRFQRYRPDTGEIIDEYELGANELLRYHEALAEMIGWAGHHGWFGNNPFSMSGRMFQDDNR